MAKKKGPRKKTIQKKVRSKKSAALRKVVAQQPVKKKSAAPKSVKPATIKKKIVKKTIVKPKAAPKKAKRGPSLGRPKFTGEALLDQVFKEDYPARQIFTYLGVTSLKELEKFAPEEIVDRLSAPLVQTVQQIRKRLADNNRHLAGDLDYAVERKQQRLGK